MDIKNAFLTIPLFEDISPSSYAALAACASLRMYRKGEHLFFDRDTVSSIYFVVRGKAALYKLNHLYEKKTIFIYGPGQMLNEVILQSASASINCELIEDSCILSFPAGRFQVIMEQDFRLCKGVMDSMALKIRRLYHQLKNTSNTVRGDIRLAAKLWKLSLDYGCPCPHGTLIDIELSITYLAELLGSKRETVSRQVKLLGEKGLLIYQKNRFIIPDRDALKKYIS